MENFNKFYTEYTNINVINEVATNRPDILKKIDLNFSSLKRNIKDKKAKQDLTDNISEFTGIKKVVISIKPKWWNACVLPIYSRDIPIAQLFKNVIQNLNNNIVEFKDNFKYVDTIYIIFGEGFIKDLSNRELTAIFLHELGHAYQHTSNLPILFKTLLSHLNLLNPILFLFSVFGTFTPIVNASLLIFSRSITVMDHSDELEADDFMVSNGYGDEGIRLFNRFRLMQKETDRKKSILTKLYDFFVSLFLPRSHPNDEKRMCYLFNKLKTDYKNEYPELDKELTIALSGINCESLFTKTKHTLDYLGADT